MPHSAPRSHARSASPRRLRSGRLVAIAAALAAVTPILGPSATPAGAVSAASTVNTGGAPLLGGFSARALDAQGAVTPKTYFELELRPGQTFSGEILVTNAAKESVRLRVDPVDGLTGQTSGTVYANREDPRRETGSWLSPRKSVLRLASQSSRRLGFTVRVPDDARPGDHVGAIAMQRILKPEQGGNFAVKQVLRVAVAVQIRVVGDARPRLELGGMSLKALGGTQIPSLGIELRNTGQLLCRPALKVSLARGGEELGTVDKQLDTILAGDTIDFPLPWPRPLEAGTYEATASTTGCGPRAETTATVVLEETLRGTTGAPGPDGAMLDDDDALPWWLIMLGLGGALGLGFFLARRTARRDDPASAPTGVATVAQVPAAE